jgi:vacuolar-type H+-ATPase subunit F/Vma7
VKKITFITTTDVKYGFSLAGVSQHAVSDADAEGTLAKAVQEPDTGLVVLDERLLGVVPAERIQEIERSGQCILLVLPSPEKPPAETEDYAARLIRRAIGYHVRLSL